MEPFIERLLSERNELHDRLSKLMAFIGSERFKPLEKDLRKTLEIQAIHMDYYLKCLNRRLDMHGVDSAMNTVGPDHA